jgi:hypothetical protein
MNRLWMGILSFGTCLIFYGLAYSNNEALEALFNLMLSKDETFTGFIARNVMERKVVVMVHGRLCWLPVQEI